ncbi:MAG TPA: TIM-barrel domain-containing protein, partial [Aggregatilineaceae bacterium]|nr:TIM-barrel domain-containing protein [Aggregatilineaceae bacterium]
MAVVRERVVIPEHFKLALKPIAAPGAVVQSGNARFTILTERLIRLEYHSEGRFEDRASQAFWFREQPVPEYHVRQTEQQISIETRYLQLRYQTGQTGFTADNLSITQKENGVVWFPGAPADDNLLGTTRTLDFINGYTPLGLGFLSRAGWSIVDDSASLVLNEDGWVEPRIPGGTDLYFLGYGHDYKACLRDYCQISGAMPMIPRWILGNWWSRYWAYTQQEFTQLINDFERYELPFSVCIIDMDWHITETGNDSTGWTGYTWNRKLFPKPEGFIQFLHDKGLKTALNLHPAEGIHCHEDAYSEMAGRTGIDPASKDPVRFNIADPAFAKAYFEVLHHPNEQMGIDFWWLDWQQGQKCTIPGLDPLWLINHLHFYDLGRDGARRPFIFSRWGNEGHQRYPIGFSGDSYRTWDTLQFESYMTATASNVAYGWWSHDIGGHTSGTEDSELFTRWVQFGVFSPIMRIHVTKGDFYDERPWIFEDAEVLNVLRDTLQLRHALIPYLYTAAQQAAQDSLPLIRPMYYEYPENEEAYHCPHQYQFGPELIAAPFVTPADPDTQLSRQVIWLPEGDWYHFFTGEHFAGQAWYPIYGRLRDIPFFAKAGAIVPLGPKTGWGGVGNPENLHLHIFTGVDHRFVLYEDDGESNHYRDGHFCQTVITQHWSEAQLEVRIEAAQGDTSLIPARRTFDLYLHGISDNAAFTVEIDGRAGHVTSHYDAATETQHLSGIQMGTASTLRLIVEQPRLARRNRKRETLLHMLRFFKLHTGVRNILSSQIEAILSDPQTLAPYLISMSQAQSGALFEILYEAGLHVIKDTHRPTQVVLWNNHAHDQITYRYGDIYLYFGAVPAANASNGSVPRFVTFTPPVQSWAHGAYGEHVHPTQWEAQIDYLNLLTVKAG